MGFFDYYNDIILERLKSLEEVKISTLTASLMKDYYLQDLLLVYLISRLIDNNKIKIIEISKERYFHNIIKINNNNL